jgi:ubiquinone/menaquinone biosynthesis C-methylase UbiE
MPPVCVEYGKSHRPHIKFVEESAENMPLQDNYFDKVLHSIIFRIKVMR